MEKNLIKRSVEAMVSDVTRIYTLSIYGSLNIAMQRRIVAKRLTKIIQLYEAEQSDILSETGAEVTYEDITTLFEGTAPFSDLAINEYLRDGQTYTSLEVQQCSDTHCYVINLIWDEYEGQTTIHVYIHRAIYE